MLLITIDALSVKRGRRDLAVMRVFAANVYGIQYAKGILTRNQGRWFTPASITLHPAYQ